MGRWELVRQGFNNAVYNIKETEGAVKIIGRKEGANIRCVSEAISRQHCQIEYKTGIFYLTDLGSLNHTFLNGSQIAPRQARELRNGDLIGLGLAEGGDSGDEYFIFSFRKKTVTPGTNNNPDSRGATSPNKPSASPSKPVALIDLTANETDSEEESIGEPDIKKSRIESPSPSTSKVANGTKSSSVPSKSIPFKVKACKTEDGELPKESVQSSSTSTTTTKQPKKEKEEERKISDKYKPQREDEDDDEIERKKGGDDKEEKKKKRKDDDDEEIEEDEEEEEMEEDEEEEGMEEEEDNEKEIEENEEEEEEEVVNNLSRKARRRPNPHTESRSETTASSPDSDEESNTTSEADSSSEDEDDRPHEEASPTKYPRRKMKHSRKEKERTRNQLQQLQEERERKKALEAAKAKATQERKKQKNHFEELTEADPESDSEVPEVLDLDDDDSEESRPRKRKAGAGSKFNQNRGVAKRKKDISKSRSDKDTKTKNSSKERKKVARKDLKKNQILTRLFGNETDEEAQSADSEQEQGNSRHRSNSSKVEKKKGESRSCETKKVILTPEKLPEFQPIIKLHRVDKNMERPPKSSKPVSNHLASPSRDREKSRQQIEQPKKRSREGRSEERNTAESSKKNKKTDVAHVPRASPDWPDSPPTPRTDDWEWDEPLPSEFIEDAEVRLKMATAKIHKKKVQARHVQMLNEVPPMRPKRGQGQLQARTSTELNPHVYNHPSEPEPPTPTFQTEEGFIFAPPMPMSKKEKLAELARVDKMKRTAKQAEYEKKGPAAPPIAKITPSSRQDKLFQDLAGRVTTATSSSAANNIDPIDEEDDAAAIPTNPARISHVVTEQDRKVRSAQQNGSSSSGNPLYSIMKEMNKPKNQRPSAAIFTIVPEVQVKPQPSTFRGDRRAESARSSSKESGHTEAKYIKEDRVYRDVLVWKPSWLNGQNSPPVHGNMELITNLPHYKGEFQAYFDTFHPLMLHELWATIVQDQGDRRKNTYMNRCGGICDFEVGIAKIEELSYCPLIPVEAKAKRVMVDNPFWHVVHVQATVEKRGIFNKDLDFGKFSYEVMNGNRTERRETFFFVKHQTELYDSLNEGGKRFRYSLQIVTHLTQKNAILLEGKCKIEKMAYLHPKLRDFRGLTEFPQSPLFKIILNPEFPRQNDVFDPRKIIPPAEYVRVLSTLLNPIQRGIAHHIASRIVNVPGPDLFLLQGPPGTGKTTTIVGLTHQILRGSSRARQSNSRILICTPSNTALDELIRRFAACNDVLKLVRVGQAISDDVKKYSLDEQVKTSCSKSSHSEVINEAISAIGRQITSLERELEIRGTLLEPGVLQTKLSLMKDLKQKQKQHEADLEKVQKNRNNLDSARRQILFESQVVFCTLNSCNGSIRKELLALDKKEIFKCCIVDESCQTTEIETLQPVISLRCEKLVLVGDPKQLPATIISHEAEKRLLGQSLFARLYNFFETRKTNDSKSPVMMLTTQYRMHPQILRWSNQRFYEGRLKTNNSVVTDPKRKLLIRPFVFLNIKGKETKKDSRLSNIDEVTLVMEILKILQKLQTRSKNHVGLSIGVISPYNEQKVKLRQLLNELKAGESGNSFADTVEVDTVDSFQGREKDIILLSCVRTEFLGFLSSPERLNVALTRAKMSLIIMGDAECLNTNEMWKSLMDDAVNANAFSHIPADYRDKGEANLSRLLEQRLLNPPSPMKK